MKSAKFIYGGIGFVGLSIMSYFLYKKFGEDEDERDLNNTIKDIQNTYGYTPKLIPNGGGKKTNKYRRNKKCKNTRRK